eukprot:8861514-Lingulodinium_polyedra.AAC.1
MRRPLGRQTIDSTALLRTVSKTVHNDAVGSTVRRHGGLFARNARAICAPLKRQTVDSTASLST